MCKEDISVINTDKWSDHAVISVVWMCVCVINATIRQQISAYSIVIMICLLEFSYPPHLIKWGYKKTSSSRFVPPHFKNCGAAQPCLACSRTGATADAGAVMSWTCQYVNDGGGGGGNCKTLSRSRHRRESSWPDSAPARPQSTARSQLYIYRPAGRHFPRIRRLTAVFEKTCATTQKKT